MISHKWGQCIDCEPGLAKPLTASRCQYHYKKYRLKINKIRDKERDIIKPDKVVGKGNIDLLFLWYQDKMSGSRPFCENCGGLLNRLDAKAWHGSQHHILEKSLFPSIATHPFNHGVLGMYCCHGLWHSSWYNAERMPFFTLARERFKLFVDDIAPEERRKIPECFFHVEHRIL